MNLRDRLNLPQKSPPRPPATPPKAPAAQARPPAAPKAPGKAGGKPDAPTVVMACGHVRAVASLAKQRCLACVDEDRRQIKERKKRATYVRQQQQFRLPSGSSLLASYDGGRQCWSGVLEVPGLPALTGEASGVMKLLDALGREAHRLLTANAGP
jgi:hypothetical protein